MILLGIFAFLIVAVYLRKDQINLHQEGTIYIYFEHKRDELHLGFQYLLTGLLSVYYDSTRNLISRPSFTGFESNRDADETLGYIDVNGLM